MMRHPILLQLTLGLSIAASSVLADPLWTTNIPPTLSVRLAKEIFGAEWDLTDHPALPEWTPAGHSNSIPLRLELIDPVTGLDTTIDEGRSSLRDDLSRWSGETNDIRWNLLFRQTGDGGLEITGHFASDIEKSLRIRIGLSIQPDGWIWHDHLSRSRPLEPQGDPFVQSPGLPHIGFESSLLPLGVISRDREAIVIANDPHEPRMFRIEADPARAYFGITYDMAVTRHTAKFPGQASFRLLIWHQNLPPTGSVMRHALAAFYHRYPKIFRLRETATGAWTPFFDAHTLPSASDFGSMLSVLASGSKPGRDGTNITTLLYSEPWYYWLPIPSSAPRTDATILNQLDHIAAHGAAFDRQLASTTKAGMALDSTDRYQAIFLDTPWNNGARCTVSVDPDAPGSRAELEFQLIDAHKKADGWSGVFLDSMSALNHRDFRMSELSTADYPVMMDAEQQRPFVPGVFSALEWLSVLYPHMAQDNRLVIGNGATRTGSMFMGHLDGFVEEVVWQDRVPADTMIGPSAMISRMLAGPRLISSGLMADFSSISQTELERYFQYALRYGFLPGFHSENGYHNMYWQNPAWYHRDRPLFQKYMPLLQRLADAGWNPVPSAASARANVHIEEFGSGQPIRIFSLYNQSDDFVTAPIDLPSDGDVIISRPLSGWLETKYQTQATPIEITLSPDEIDVITVIPVEHLDTEINRYPAGDRNHVNLSSLNQERMVELEVRLDLPIPVIRNRDVQIGLVFRNNGNNPLNISGITAQSAARRRSSSDSQFILPPGTARTAFIRLRSVDLENNPAMDVEWQVKSKDLSFTGRRVFQPAYADMQTITVAPASIVSIDPVTALDVHIQNPAAETREFEVSTRDNTAKESQTQKVIVEAGRSYSHRVYLTGEGSPHKTISVTVTENNKLIHRQEIPALFLPAGSNFLRDHRIRLTSTGTEKTYRLDALRDGVADPGGRLWSEVSWQSIRRMDEHRIEIIFPQPVTIQEINLIWGSDALQSHPPASGFVKAVLPDGQSVMIHHYRPEPHDARTSIAIAPTQVSELQIIQPALSGPALQPMMMWLNEIEVF